MTLAERITERRQALGLNKAALGRKVGVSDVAIGYWESGEIREIGHEKLLRLAGALETTVSELLDDPGLAHLVAKKQAEGADLFADAWGWGEFRPDESDIRGWAKELHSRAEEEKTYA